MSNQPRRRGPMGGGHGRMGTGEKAKDFKGTMKKLFTYIRGFLCQPRLRARYYR